MADRNCHLPLCLEERLCMSFQLCIQSAHQAVGHSRPFHPHSLTSEEIGHFCLLGWSVFLSLQAQWACCFIRDKRNDHLFTAQAIDCWFLGSSSFSDTWSPVKRQTPGGTKSFPTSPPCFPTWMDRPGQNVILQDHHNLLFMPHNESAPLLLNTLGHQATLQRDNIGTEFLPYQLVTVCFWQPLPL